MPTPPAAPPPAIPGDDAGRFRAVWAAASDALALSDPDGLVIDANPAYYALYGYGPAEVLGHSFAVIFPEEERAAAEAQYRAIFAQAAVAPTVLSTVQRQDGSTRHVEVRYTFLTDAAGQRTALLSVIRDVTARTRAERQQRAFLAMVGHELRTPLTAIIGQPQLLLRRGTANARAVERILAQGRRLDRLVGDLVDLARLEAGQLAVTLAPLELGGLVTRAVADARLAAPTHAIAAAVPDAPVVVRGDAGRLRQVLDNLLGNAVKYSPAGSTVEVRLALVGAEARVAVTDAGPGIPAEAQAHLFERFYRAPAARGSSTGGLGLGLAICQGLVAAHGGRLGVASTPGQGSTFWFTLPRASAEPHLPE